MALNVPVGDALVVFKHRLAGDSDDMLVIIGIEMPPDFDNANGLAAANDLFTKWSTNMKTTVTGDLSFIGCQIQRKEPDGFLLFDSTAATVVGTGSGSALPPNVALLGHKNSNRGGRSGRGRIFMPGLSEAGVDPAGNLLTANLTQANASFAATFTALSTAVSVDHIEIFHDDSIANPAPTEVTGFTADPKVATMRRRLRR